MVDETRAELERIVKSRMKGQIRDFQLLVDSQGLVLRGTAASYYAKQMAQQLVMGATKTPIALNEIDVIDGRSS